MTLTARRGGRASVGTSLRPSTDTRTDVELLAPSQDDLHRWRSAVSPEHPRHPLRSADAAAVWNGVVWGRLGRCDLAWAWWDSVDEPTLQPWIAGERGRILRELGLHEQAAEVEEEGLTTARDVVDVVLLRLSLAADAVGRYQRRDLPRSMVSFTKRGSRSRTDPPVTKARLAHTHTHTHARTQVHI